MTLGRSELVEVVCRTSCVRCSRCSLVFAFSCLRFRGVPRFGVLRFVWPFLSRLAGSRRVPARRLLTRVACMFN